MNPLLTVLVVSIVFVGAFLALSFVYWGVQARKEEEARELSRRLGQMSGDPGDSLFRTQVKDELAQALGSTGERMEILLQQAAVNYTVSGLLTRMALFGLLGLVIMFVLLRNAFGVIGIIVAFVPYIVLVSQANARASKISQQLPEALDLMARGLRAGHGLSDAFRMCAEEMPQPISVEFGRVYEEHNLGRDMREALVNLTRRNPANFDMRIFVSSVLLQRDTGGNMIEILQNISKTIRDRFVFQGKVKSMTAEARFSAYILGGLPFVVAGLIMVMRPEYLEPLVDDPIGNGMLIVAACLFSTGVFVMRKVSQVEV
ncbi:MAG: type II secretion system F family protein [Alphaproteobacteria bacterium]|nr:type II secretion system F family protein [Alphaproteobacteria bacterium]